MKPHDALSEKLRAEITEFLFQGMGADRHDDFQDHLRLCEVCRTEAASQRRLAVELGFVAPVRSAPPKQDAPKQPWKHWAGERSTNPYTLVTGGPEGFEPTAYPGIAAKRIFVDERNDRVTMIVRMAPKSSYPSHKHGGVEECFVVEGDLKAGPVTLHAGDYQRAGAGSIHAVQTTDSGCILFLVSSLRDEIEE